MVPIPVAGPMDRVGIDILGPLTTTESGNKYILVCTDYLTKWAQCYALANMSAETVVQIFMERFVCIFGCPLEILSDRGPTFLANCFRPCVICVTPRRFLPLLTIHSVMVLRNT